MMSENGSPAGRLTTADKAQGALIGFAIGDALGWPNESRSRSKLQVGKSADQGSLTVTFREWIKRSGGRFDSYEEIIRPGEYSDDTQLMLCTARSVLMKENWWRHFTRRELPTWTLYERGGGKATRAATKSWAQGRKPWEVLRQRRDSNAPYYEAGGNGAAMRILPHAVFRASAREFQQVAEEIAANSICTHGHPRALLGALAYGYAAWLVLRKFDTLRYGELIGQLLSSVQTWSQMPRLDKHVPDWIWAAENVFGTSYAELWNRAVGELVDLLKICDSAMNRGALSVDRSVLDEIGGLDRKTNGAGTVSAAGAIFLASRYAVNPQQAVIEAAFSRGADTDTLAAMTGGLLGALSGTDAFRDYADQVQDAPYLRRIALELVSDGDQSQQLTLDNHFGPGERSVEAFLSQLATRPSSGPLVLPDGRSATVVKRTSANKRSSRAHVDIFLLKVHDGQTIYVRKIAKTRTAGMTDPTQFYPVRPEIREQFYGPRTTPKSESQARIGLILVASYPAETKHFYERVLGLPISQETERTVNFNGVLSLIPAAAGERSAESHHESLRSRPVRIRVETNSFDAVLERVLRNPATAHTTVSTSRQRRFFRCFDPEGNLVEVTEA